MKQKPSKRQARKPQLDLQQPPPFTPPSLRHVQSIEMRHSGPLPPAEDLQKYDQVLPGLAGRIMTMAEDEAVHRRAMERKSSWREFIVTIIGQVFAFSTTALLVGLAAYLIMNDKEVAGFISMAASVIPSVTAIYLKKKEN